MPLETSRSMTVFVSLRQSKLSAPAVRYPVLDSIFSLACSLQPGAYLHLVIDSVRDSHDRYRGAYVPFSKLANTHPQVTLCLKARVPHRYYFNRRQLVADQRAQVRGEAPESIIVTLKTLVGLSTDGDERSRHLKSMDKDDEKSVLHGTVVVADGSSQWGRCH